MPHFIIECSDQVIQQKSPNEIMQAVYKVAEKTGLFAANDIKVRILPYQHFKLHDDKANFIHVFAHILEGRAVEQCADLSRQVIERLNELFPNFAIISININEFLKATYSNQSLVNCLDR